MTQFAYNKKAKFDYETLDTFEAGLVLSGQEVKAIRAGQASLNGAYVTISRDGQLYLLNASIAPYKMAGPLPDYDPNRSRKVLLHKKEINFLRGKLEQSGLTLVPISLYNKHNKIKLEITLAKGKKKVDKRRTIKERDEKRQINRILRQK